MSLARRNSAPVEEKEEKDDREPEDILMDQLSIPWDVRRQSMSLRVNMSGFEKKVWNFLGKHENPWGFLRQWPMDGYFFDFYSQHYCVALEADGPDHLNRVAEDLKRDKVMAKKGVRTIRLTPADFKRKSAGDLYLYVRDAVENVDPDAKD